MSAGTNRGPSGETLESITWLLDAAREEEYRMRRSTAELARAIRDAAFSEDDGRPALDPELATWQAAKQRADLLREMADHEARAILRQRKAGAAEQLLADWERIQEAEALAERLEHEIQAAQDEGNTGWIHGEGTPRLKAARERAEALRADLTAKLL